MFRGAGWNVIKVILGSKWDELLANDKDGVLLNQLNITVDGEFQRYGTESGAYIREHFFGPDPRLRQMVAHLSDDDLVNLPRGGHDYRKLYAAYKAASDNLGSGAPTAILCKTIKGWTLGPGFEGRNSTHQIKKMNKEQLLELRNRLYLHDEIPESALDENPTPYFRPGKDSIEYQYMMERRQALGGSLPRRVLRYKQPVPLPDDEHVRRAARRLRRPGGVDDDGLHPPAAQPVTRQGVRPLRRADHPRRGPHLRHGLAVPAAQDLRRPGPEVRAGRSRAAAQLRRVADRPDPRGGHHRGRLDGELHRRRHRLRDPRHPHRPVLRLLLDVRLPAGGRPAVAGGRFPHPRLPGRSHRRSHHAARRGPPAPGRPLARARQHRAAGAGLRPGVRLRGRHDRAAGPAADVRRQRRVRPGRLLLPHPLQRELRDAGDARARAARRRDARAVPVVGAPGGQAPCRHAAVQRLGAEGRLRGRRHARRPLRRRRGAVVGHVVQGAARRGIGGRALEPAAPEPGAAGAGRDRAARRRGGTDRRRQRLHEDRPRADPALRGWAHVPAPRHRRDGSQRHPRGPAPALRDRRRARGGRRAQRPGRRGPRRAGDGRKGDRRVRHRPRPARPRPRRDRHAFPGHAGCGTLAAHSLALARSRPKRIACGR